MKRFLFAAAAKVGLFLFSIALGIVSYTVVHRIGEAPAENSLPGDRLDSVSFDPDIALDAEPFLLAKTNEPVDIVGDALGIFYILQKNGEIIRVSPEVGGSVTSAVYASLATFETEPGRGFSCLALHPDFLMKDRPGYGRFYVISAERPGAATVDFAPEFGATREDHQDVVYEFQVEDPLYPAFRGKKRELMRFSQPGTENNLCGLAFDFCGNLYLGVGDGAAGEIGSQSTSRNASSLSNAFGKVLRIDPLGNNSANGAYGIPEGNPFKLVSDALPELWVFGLRAPQSLFYDPFQSSLCIGESGINGRQEINLSLYGGEHFGWDIDASSGKMSLGNRAQLAEIVTGPLLELDLHAGVFGRTTGSVVYRGENFPSLAGRLIFASHDGQLIAARQYAGKNVVQSVSRIDPGRLHDKCFSALRSGPRGELVLLCDDGNVYEMRKGSTLGSGSSRQRSLYCLIEKFLPSNG
jgi:hypothetical protein